MIKTLLFSSLYPNSQKPRHGIFVETRLRQLLRSEQVETKVVAPIASFPVKSGVFKRYAESDSVPSYELLNGIDVYHPKFFILPKIGGAITPVMMARAALPVIKKLIAQGFDFDVIDAHYFYPDGVAAAILAKKLNKPLVITARGTDVNLFADYKFAGRLIKKAASQSNSIITVAESLRHKLVTKGISQEKIQVLRNGVDKEVFYPASKDERESLRQQLNINSNTILSVGNLTKLKGFNLVLDAVAKQPDIKLIIIGDGEERQNLQQQVSDLKISQRVQFISNLSQQQLRDYYVSADILVLASSREGMPNVVLESLACGTPVVATNVGGVSEILSNECGIIVNDRTGIALAKVITTILNAGMDREVVAEVGAKNSWERTTQGQLGIFASIISNKIDVSGRSDL